MNKHYPLLIVGAGPAGLSAATLAANHGLECAVLDEQPAPGGQIYRNIEHIPDSTAQTLGPDYLHGRRIAEDFRHSGAKYFPETRVWSLNPEREIGLTRQNESRMITADAVLIASGAMERPIPFPGWTLPGVMQAGAGQILLKTAQLIPEKNVVLAGSGPLLLLLAWQYMRLGTDIAALLDTTPFSNTFSALPKLPKALRAFHYLSKGLTLQKDLKQAGVSIIPFVEKIAAIGDDQLEAIEYQKNGKIQRIETGLLLTHFGVIPHIWLSQAAGCQHRWDDYQQCWRPVTDRWGRTSLDSISIAGDNSGIFGAKSAEFAGQLAALACLHKAGKLSLAERDRLAKPIRQKQQKDRAIRPFLERYFHLPQQWLLADDDTLVCRCEEISAGAIRQVIQQGHDDSNQVKYFTRCGMGPCQGRQCALSVAQIVAAETGRSKTEVGIFRDRPPVTPINLKQLSVLNSENT